MPRKRVVEESIELTLIRKKLGIEGKLLDYLKTGERGASEQVLRALNAFYLPFMNAANGASEEEIRYAALEAICELEMQALKIKRMFGLDGMSQLLLTQPTLGGGLTASIPVSSESVKETIINSASESKEISNNDLEEEEDEDDNLTIDGDLEIDEGLRISDS